MSKPLESEIENLAWKLDGKHVEIIVPLFEWVPTEMLNVKTMKKQTRLVWGYTGRKTVSLFQQARSGAPLGILTEPAEYELQAVPKSNKNPSGFRKVRKRVKASGLTCCAVKLSSLTYGSASMALPISPDSLQKLIEQNYAQGNFIDSGASAKFVMIRTNDLERRMEPQEGDHWVVLRTLNPKAIKGLVIPVNDAEKRSGSSWREIGANQDPMMQAVLEEISGDSHG